MTVTTTEDRSPMSESKDQTQDRPLEPRRRGREVQDPHRSIIHPNVLGRRPGWRPHRKPSR